MLSFLKNCHNNCEGFIFPGFFMSISKFLIKISIITVFLTSACSTRTGTGAVFGTLTGVTTGALVGTLLSRGDVAASALLGGAVGLPIGLLIGYHLQQKAEESVEQKKVDKYMSNQDRIYKREKEIEALREEVVEDSPNYENDDAEAIRIYKGKTLGNPNR